MSNAKKIQRMARIFFWSLIAFFALLKLALITGVIALAISLCSCSASKPEAQNISPEATVISASTPVESSASDIRSMDSVASDCKAADSVSRKSLKELIANSQVEISDLSLTYTTGHSRRHKTLTIGRLTASKSTAEKSVSATDSAVFKTAAVSGASKKENTTDMVYQRKSPNTAARIILALAALFGILIGYLYYRQKKLS